MTDFTPIDTIVGVSYDGDWPVFRVRDMADPLDPEKVEAIRRHIEEAITGKLAAILNEVAENARINACHCRGANCRTRIIWANHEETGKAQPLDASAPVYRLRIEGSELVAVRDRAAFVGHHATCRDAKSF